MKRMNLLLVCGLAATISSPALAQSGNQPGQERPGQQPGQQDRQQDRQARLGQQGGQQDAQQVLKQLEGSWHIEIKMDPQLFGQQTMGADRQRMPGQDRDRDPTRDREDPTQRDQTDPTQRDQDDPTQRDRTQQPGQQNQPGQQDRERTLGADQQGLVTSRGYSQNRLILDDKVLHEAAVIITGGEGAPGAAAQSGSDQIQALSFLGFDEQSNQYSFVIMTDRAGKINCNHGEYDTTSKQITFQKEGQMRQGMGEAGKPNLDNVKIVLEIVSNDEHKVTMYDTSASGATPGMRDREDREQDRTPGVQPGQRQQDRQQGQSKQHGKVVYEATYTRAEGQPGQPGQPGQQDRMPGQQRQPGQQQPGGGGGQ